MAVLDMVAKLSLDTTNYERGLNQASNDATGFGNTFTKGISVVKKLGAAAFAAASAAVVKFGVDSIKTGAEFDSSMSQVAATMGTTVDQIQDLRDFAQEMGATTAFSAVQAADALNYMALAGYDAETSMAMLPNVLNLAAAGSMDLARASDMITDTQTAFGISLDRTTQLVDEMAKAASTGNTSVEQLGDAFLVVGGLAQELNGGIVTLSDGTEQSVDGIQEMEIALTAMANAGIKGSEAGTHMRNMLMKLSNPTKEGTEALEKMNIAIFDSDGKMRSLADIFGDLNREMSTMTQEEKIQTISALFNSRDLSSAEAILNAIGDDWNTIGAAIVDSAGAADQMAKTQLDNLKGDVTILKSAFEGLQIAVSDKLSPTLRNVVQWATEGIGKIQAALEKDGLMGAVDALGEILGQKIGEFFANLPEIAVKAVEIAGEAVFNLIAGIGKGFDLSFFEESTYAADNLKEAYQGVLTIQEEMQKMYGMGWEEGSEVIDRYTFALQTAQDNLEELRGSEEARIAVLKEVESGTMSYKEASELLGVSIDTVAHMLVLQKEKTEDATDASDDLEESEDGLVDVNKDLIELQNEFIEQTSPLFIKALMDAGSTVEDLTQYLSDNGIELEDWLDAVEKTTDGVINGFQRVSTSMNMSLDEMAENLEFNIRAHHEWQENIDTLMNAAIESGDAAKIAFVQHMQEMGVGAAEQVALMVEDVDTTLDTFGPLFEAAAIEGVAGMTDSIESGAPEVQAAVSGLLLAAESAASGAYGSGMTIGELLAAGVAAGMTKLEAIQQVEVAAVAVVSRAKGAMENRAIIQSPSKLFMRDIGEMITYGVAEGIMSESALNMVRRAAELAVKEAHGYMTGGLNATQEVLSAYAETGAFDTRIDFSALMLAADSLTDFFQLADMRDEKIAGLGIDLAAEGWRTTADLLTEWMQQRDAEFTVADDEHLQMYKDHSKLLTDAIEENNDERLTIYKDHSKLLNDETNTNDDVRNQAIISKMDEIIVEIDTLGARIEQMQIILDSGVIAGEISPLVNVELGQQSVFDGRGI